MFPPQAAGRIESKKVSVPLRGVGCFCLAPVQSDPARGFRPLAGCGLFLKNIGGFNELASFRPLAGCGLFLRGNSRSGNGFVSVPLRGVGCFGTKQNKHKKTKSFRPLAGCGLFRQSCTFFLVQQEKELSTLLFYCIILADVYQ